jgi:phage gpG-like protein
MTVRGDTQDLQALRKLCQGEAVKSRMLRAASGEGLKLVQMGFRTGTNPNDDPWEPLKSRKGVILVKTARMRNSFTSRPSSTGFVVGSNDEKVKWHQDGTKGHRAHTQQRFISGNGRFVRMANMELMTGKARSGGRLKSRQVRGIRTLQMKEGGGGIPARQMVPPNGMLTPKWQTGIDNVCNEVMQKSMAEAGAK